MIHVLVLQKKREQTGYGANKEVLLFRKEKKNPIHVRLLCPLSIVHIMDWMGFSPCYYWRHTIWMTHPAVGLTFVQWWHMWRKKNDLEQLRQKIERRSSKKKKTPLMWNKNDFMMQPLHRKCSKAVFMRLSRRTGDANILTAARCVGLDFSGAANEERICLMAVMLVQLNLACWFRSCLCYLWFMAMQ